MEVLSKKKKIMRILLLKIKQKGLIHLMELDKYILLIFILENIYLLKMEIQNIMPGVVV